MKTVENPADPNIPHCCNATPERVPGACPKCGCTGHRVLTETVNAWVIPERCSWLGRAPYLFCKTAGCPVVYFSLDGEAALLSDVHSRVGLKIAAGLTPACYCFGHTAEAIASEVRMTGDSRVVELISAEIKAGHCACETKNPEGRCCLGNVSQLVKEAKGKYNKPVDPPKDEEAPVVCNSTLCAT